MTSVFIVHGDITKLNVDAIVNAANTSLLGGGGVDGAIHRAAGPELAFECRLLGGCKSGMAKITGGYKLPVKKIIHTVGPVWQGGTKNEAAILASCYTQCLDIAAKTNLHSIAFPCISTGRYSFPNQLAANIAIDCIRFPQGWEAAIEEVYFCCHQESDFFLYKALCIESNFEECNVSFLHNNPKLKFIKFLTPKC